MRNLGRGFISNLLEERKNGDFVSLPDLCERMYGKELNRRTAEALIKSGALDGLGANRAQMLYGWEGLAGAIDAERRGNADGQTNLFGFADEDSSVRSFKFPPREEFPLEELLRMEKEMTGLYISGHPLERYADFARAIGAVDIAEYLPDSGYDEETGQTGQLHDRPGGENVSFVAIIQGKSTKTTKNGDMMAFATLEDMTGEIEALLFPRIYEDCREAFVVGNVVAVSGRISSREDEAPKLICENLRLADNFIGSPELFLQQRQKNDGSQRRYPPRRQYQEQSDAPQQPQPPQQKQTEKRSGRRPGLYIKAPSQKGRLFERVSSLLSVFDGDTQVYVFFEDTGKLVLAPQKLWTEPNAVLLAELRRQLGEKNVALVE